MPGEPELSRTASSQDRKRKQSPSSSAMPEAPAPSSSSTPAYQQSTITEHFTPKSQAAAFKRSKPNFEESNNTSSSASSKAPMKPITEASMFNFGSKVEPIDLTKSAPAKPKGPVKPPPFQTHSGGTRKLKVKNLRPQEKNKAENYFNTTWTTLDAALSAIFSQQKVTASMEELYRGVENICRSERSAPLYKKLEVRCDDYVSTTLRLQILKDIGTDTLSVARVLEGAWQQWSRQLSLIRSIFLYLDRSYLFPSPNLPSIESMGIAQFRKHIASYASIKPQLLAGICALFQQDRENRGRESVNQQLLQSLVHMILSLGLYSSSFEPVFIEDSREYYAQLSKRESSTLGLEKYLREAQEQLDGEATRCDDFRLEYSTKRELIAVVEDEMIRTKIDILTNAERVRRLLVEVDKMSLKTLYELLSRTGNAGELLKPAWEVFITDEGTRIVSDKERVTDMVPLLLNFKAMLDMLWNGPLKKDDILGYSLRDTFTKFINARRPGESESNHSKPAEMIAKYVDQVLRSGTKGLPPIKYIHENNTMQDDDAEIAYRLELAVALFRFIQGKDVFEAFYKKDLARRLLMDRSASFDAERLMLTKLKTECGSGFTHNLESMFKDMDLSKESVASFKTSKAFASKSGGVDLHVNVLSSAAWPTYPEVPVNLPPKLANYLEAFAEFYVSKHSGRKLAWRHSLSHCILKADFPKGKKELMLSAFQAVVLLCFNDLPDRSVLTYKDLLTATGLAERELKRTLQSLALGKSRVLTKAPKGKDIGSDDKFAVNLSFADPKYRVKINQIQLKETKEENKETHERVAKDRQFETQAAITRIMKSRKQATEVELVQAVIEQTKGRGVLDVGEIKKNIERLIDKDYIERVDGHDNLYAYVA